MKAKEFAITDAGREIRVRVTKMSAMQAMDFVTDTCLLLGVDNLSQFFAQSSEAVAKNLVKASGKSAEVKALLDRLLLCCERVTDEGGAVQLNRATVSGQFEDWFSIMQLYILALGVNFDFFGAGGLSAYREKLTSIGQQLRSAAWLNS